MKLALKAACTLAFLSGAAHAHDVWVIAPTQQPADRVLEADLGYSHVYPLPEAIAADRVQIFKPMEIIDSQNRATAMVLRGGENYQYATRNPLKAGTYRVTATYQPTFWVKNAQGKWSQNNMTQVPDATYCEQSQMYGKSIVQVGDRFDLAAATRPVGQELEIVPLANPNTVAAGKLLPLQVLYQGKPLAGATVVATADTVINQDTDAMMDQRELPAAGGRPMESESGAQSAVCRPKSLPTRFPVFYADCSCGHETRAIGRIARASPPSSLI